MERPIKGGYILVSLGLIALSTSYSGSIDYDKISRTKKHIVLTGIKVGDTVMPDICVKPVYGNGTITFEDVYGFDVVVKSDSSVEVSVTTSLDSRFVRKMKAPASTTLTEEQIALIKEGVFIEGTFLGITNPILFPWVETNNEKRGIVLAPNGIKIYRIQSNNEISLSTLYNIDFNHTNNSIYMKGLVSLNDKAIPTYPSNTGTFILKMVNGTLTWVAE